MSFDFLKDRPLVANISGGEDSTAMALFLIENNLKFTPVFCDTGWEHEATYEYLNYLEKFILKQTIKRLHNKKYFQTEIGGYEEMVLRDLSFPSNMIRKCTMDLKVNPQLDFMDELRIQTGAKPISAVGIRKEESQAIGEFEEKDEMTIWRPLIDWDFQKVVDIHKKHNVPPNPLYTKGFSRVGCFPCIFARKNEIKQAYREDPVRFDRIRELEKTVKQIKKDKQYSFFKRGLVDEVLDWALKNDNQQFFEEEYLSGYLTWGLCDSGLPRHLVSEEDYEKIQKEKS